MEFSPHQDNSFIAHARIHELKKTGISSNDFCVFIGWMMAKKETNLVPRSHCRFGNVTVGDLGTRIAGNTSV